MCEGESTREEERAGPGGFQRRLVGAGGPAADLETWVGLQSQRGRSACPNLGQENWCCRNKDQSATAQSPVLANLKIPALSIFFFPSWSLFFSPSFLFSSFSDDPFWQCWDSLAYSPPREAPHPHWWAKPLQDSLLFRYRPAAAPKAPNPLDSVLSNAN